MKMKLSILERLRLRFKSLFTTFAFLRLEIERRKECQSSDSLMTKETKKKSYKWKKKENKKDFVMWAIYKLAMSALGHVLRNRQEKLFAKIPVSLQLVIQNNFFMFSCYPLSFLVIASKKKSSKVFFYRERDLCYAPVHTTTKQGEAH